MSVDRSTRLFFDASCLIAAAGSASGGSARILMLCSTGLFVPVVSPLILLEAERNIRDNLKPSALLRFEEGLRSTPFVVVPVPDSDRLAVSTAIVSEKDAHVLAAADGCPFLLTLDKKPAESVNRETSRLVALSPGDFTTQLAS